MIYVITFLLYFIQTKKKLIIYLFLN